MCIRDSYSPEFYHILGDLCINVWQWNTDAVLQTGHSAMSALRIPPLNFIQYNLHAGNLAEHGLHPWYTHFLVNFPLLLGPLALLFYWDLAVLLRHCRQKHFTDVLYGIVVLPVLSLSFFPHQEARFLLPVLPVAVVCAARNSLAKWKSFKTVTLLFNILAFGLFGWLHQGGIVPALSALQNHMKNISTIPANYGAHFHVVAYTAYMPPRHLLFAESSKIQLHVHDMIGANNHPPTFQLQMEELNSSCQKELLKCHFFILLPTTAVHDLRSISGWQLTEEAEFCPHMSMERLPTSTSLRTTEDLYELLRQLCLKVISVKMWETGGICLWGAMTVKHFGEGREGDALTQESQYSCGGASGWLSHQHRWSVNCSSLVRQSTLGQHQLCSWRWATVSHCAVGSQHWDNQVLFLEGCLDHHEAVSVGMISASFLEVIINCSSLPYSHH